jgi:pimeloyl-ACP methyl ester carboxylesterase
MLARTYKEPLEKPFLIFVPGILGTELRDIDGKMIWGGDLAAILDTLCLHPRALTRSTLRVGNVIESIKTPWPGGIKVYGPALRMIRERLGYDTGTFQAFPYDWRQSNVESATKLARFMRQKIEEGIHRFSILAHSMGGIVTRLTLQDSKNSDLLSRMSGYVQIATPVRGSSKAYFMVKHGPAFYPLFDRIRYMIDGLASSRLHALLDGLGGWDSIFQLLPPPDEKILKKQSGIWNGCFDPDVWPRQYGCSLDMARAVHASIQAVPQWRHYTIVSNGVNTDHSYQVDDDFDIIRPHLQAGGDGTVVEDSAQSGSDSDGLIIMSEHIRHDQLQNREDVFDMILKEGWLGNPVGHGAK